ncbi:MAG: hypothetical protein PHS41_03135 [Victivallaceae bacterium]|nr:hypothetical protein [Victivallaceae bacterium]
MSTILGVTEIKKRIPYCFPMLMLDRAQILDDNTLLGVKNLTINEPFFQGHFPGHPIMPGVLQVEAMRQLCQLAAGPRLDPQQTQDVYLRLIERVKFRVPNLPGDRIRIEAKEVAATEDSITYEASCTNNSGLCCQGRLTLSVRPKTEPDAMPELFNAYDKGPNTSLDVQQIMELVPHRYPFLLFDNVTTSQEGGKVIGVKNLSADEPLFQGRSDGYMVLSEAIFCEMAAQAGCASILSQPENRGKIGYFMTIDRGEALAPVFPGDQLRCEVNVPPGGKRFGKSGGEIKCGDKVVYTISLMFAIVDK